MSTSSKRKSRAAAALALATGVAGLVTAPAHADGERLVALGDSYSSGTGAGQYLDDGTDCRRTLLTYSGVIAGDAGLALDLQACSGAVTADVLRSQLGTLGSSTDFVTISIGGNDVGFANVVTECAKPGWMGDCDGAIDDALRIAEQELPQRLDDVYSAIDARAPQATVVVAGYPRLFNGRDCHIATFFSGAEMTRLNNAADQLNAITKRVANSHGFKFADVRPAFEGHAVCDSPEWIHNVRITDITESFHPKVDGYRYGYAPEVRNQLGVGTGSASTMTVTTGGTTSTDTTRGQVRIPDLASAEARAAARKAGVTPSELDAMVRAQQSGASNAQLERMSAEAAS